MFAATRDWDVDRQFNRESIVNNGTSARGGNDDGGRAIWRGRRGRRRTKQHEQQWGRGRVESDDASRGRGRGGDGGRANNARRRDAQNGAGGLGVEEEDGTAGRVGPVPAEICGHRRDNVRRGRGFPRDFGCAPCRWTLVVLNLLGLVLLVPSTCLFWARTTSSPPAAATSTRPSGHSSSSDSCTLAYRVRPSSGHHLSSLSYRCFWLCSPFSSLASSSSSCFSSTMLPISLPSSTDCSARTCSTFPWKSGTSYTSQLRNNSDAK